MVKQSHNQLGTPGGAKNFWEGPKFSKLRSIISNYIQHILPGWVGAKKFAGLVPLRPPGYGPMVKLAVCMGRFYCPRALRSVVDVLSASYRAKAFLIIQFLGPFVIRTTKNVVTQFSLICKFSQCFTIFATFFSSECFTLRAFQAICSARGLFSANRGRRRYTIQFSLSIVHWWTATIFRKTHPSLITGELPRFSQKKHHTHHWSSHSSFCSHAWISR